VSVQLTVADGKFCSVIRSGLFCQVVFSEKETPILPLSVQLSRH